MAPDIPDMSTSNGPHTLIDEEKIESTKSLLPEDLPLRRPRPQSPVGVKSLTFRNQYVRCFLAEFLGTFILVSLGCASIAQTVLSFGQNGNIVTIMMGWGLAIMCGLYVSIGTSGGHINPAVTLVMALLRKLPWKMVPVYMAAQYIGAFFAAMSVYVIYHDNLNRFEQELSCNNVTRAVSGPCATAGIWATYPIERVTDIQGFSDQVFATGLLMMLILAITDKKNIDLPTGAVPPVLALVIMGIVAGYGLNVGAPLNPARDLSPRIFTAIIGYGTAVFRHPTPFWWLVPVFGPHVGACFGAMMYYLFVGLHNSPVELEKYEREMKSLEIYKDKQIKIDFKV